MGKARDNVAATVRRVLRKRPRLVWYAVACGFALAVVLAVVRGPKLMGRTLKGVFSTALLVMLPFLIATAAAVVVAKWQPELLHARMWTVMVTACIVTALIAALSLPLMHVLMKYIMEAPRSYWRTLTTSYGRGMARWGMLFIVFFVSILLTQLVELVVMMPAHVLNLANQTAHNGLLIGDPLGMPSYMTALTFATFTLCCFIQFYVSQVVMVHNYYAYGAIETKEQERRKQKMDI